jgi:type III secretion protein W
MTDASASGSVGGSRVLAAMHEAGKLREALIKGVREDSQSDMHAALVDDAVEGNFTATTKKRKKKLETRRKRVGRKDKPEDKEDLSPSAIKKIKNSAEKFEKKNPELKKKTLQTLREHIKPGDSKNTILKKVKEFYGDISNADDALDFLLETTGGELHEAVKQAKDEINKHYKRDIVAGKNISEEARAFSKEGLGSATALRDTYRDVINNPRDPRSQFDFLEKKFGYEKLQKAIKFMFNAIGRDLRSQGPSISRGFLHRLFTETRTLQMILGVYNHFKGKMALLKSLFTKNGLKMPSQLNFESLAKSFMSLTGERYPSSDAVMKMARAFRIDSNLLSKIFVFSQFRDAINAVAADKIYRSIQHRHELYAAIIEALEELEDELEIKEEEEEERKRNGEEQDDDQDQQDDDQDDDDDDDDFDDLLDFEDDDDLSF